MPNNPDLSQGQSRRCADPGAGAHLGSAHARPALRCRLHHPRAEALAGARHRAGERRRQLAACGARARQSARAESPGHRPRAGARRAGRGQLQPAQRAGRGRRPAMVDLRQRSGVHRRRNTCRSSSRSATAPRCACRDVAEVVDSVQDKNNAAVSNGQPAVLLILYREPNANILETVQRVQDLLPWLRASMPAAMEVSVAMERTSHDPRLDPRGRAHADHRGRAGRAGGVRLPAQPARDADSGGGRAGVADRHVRLHVPRRLQRQQSLADGADRGGRIRGRRRDRRAREHHAPHRARHGACARRRSSARAKSGSRCSR